MDRFFAAELNQSGVSVTLDETESHHLAKVLRKNLDDVVELFDGHGASATAVVERIEKRKVHLRIRDELKFEPVPTSTLTLAVAPPKGDRFRWLVEKATELGVDKLIPLNTERSVVNPRDAKLEKMRHAVIAACKQCRRNRLMEIAEPITWSELLEQAIPEYSTWIAHPGGQEWRELPWKFPETNYLFIIGPEGGLTDAEVESAIAAGAKAISLGPRILRIETAAIAIAAVLGASR